MTLAKQARAFKLAAEGPETAPLAKDSATR